MYKNNFKFYNQVLDDNKELIAKYLEDHNFTSQIDYFANNYDYKWLFLLAAELKTKIIDDNLNIENKQEVYKMFLAIILAIKELEKEQEDNITLTKKSGNI